ncbi:MAG TPA: GYF domain-containing protein, partial [Candidatus Synoicihabitans sp.]|nr:GYF domain-containing protein [Candidatus Synoicihabitans sp.]
GTAAAEDSPFRNPQSPLRSPQSAFPNLPCSLSTAETASLAMAMQEYYIRNVTDTEARGPFNMEQLSSLAENGQVQNDTLYYDAVAEQWATVGSNAELLAQLFPEKKQLKVKPKEKIATLNTSTENAAPIEVTDMLAAAEGRSPDTKDKADPTEALARSAKLGMLACTATLFISAAALLAPFVETIVANRYLDLLTEPLALLGALDIVLGLLMALGTASIYPFVRFRAALGAGFVGLVFWTQGHPSLALAAVAGSAGLYLSTIFTNLAGVLVAVALGLIGMGYFAYGLILL